MRDSERERKTEIESQHDETANGRLLIQDGVPAVPEL